MACVRRFLQGLLLGLCAQAEGPQALQGRGVQQQREADLQRAAQHPEQRRGDMVHHRRVLGMAAEDTRRQGPSWIPYPDFCDFPVHYLPFLRAACIFFSDGHS